MSKPDPVFQFLRTTPAGLRDNPPLASSLQAFETSLELIALGRYPAALIACVNAWESALKAGLKIPEGPRTPSLRSLLGQIENTIRPSANWYPERNLELIDKRNHMTHYGYTPRDSGECADLLLQTGYPGLCQIYVEFFGYHLMWQQIEPSIPSFNSLPAASLDRVGILPQVGDFLWLALDQFRRQQTSRSLDPQWYLRPLAWELQQGFRGAWTSQAEQNALVAFETRGGLFEEQQRIKQQVSSELGDFHTFFSCPICNGIDMLALEFDEKAAIRNQLQTKRCLCASCHFFLPEEAGFLAESLLGDEVPAAWQELRADCGLS